MESVADRIKKLRAEFRLSQEALGKLAGVSKSAVSQWERGLTAPERDALLHIQRKLKISADWIAEGRGPMRVSAPSPVEPGPEVGAVLREVEALLPKASPRSHASLLRIAKAASEGKLTEEDLELLEKIAERLTKR